MLFPWPEFLFLALLDFSPVHYVAILMSLWEVFSATPPFPQQKLPSLLHAHYHHIVYFTPIYALTFACICDRPCQHIIRGEKAVFLLSYEWPRPHRYY